MSNFLNFKLPLRRMSLAETAVSLMALANISAIRYHKIPGNIFRYLFKKKVGYALFFRNRAMIFFLLPVLILSSERAGAQDPLIFDSLQDRLKTEKHDTAKVRILIEMGENSDNPKDKLLYAQKSLQLAEKIQYKKGMADALNDIGYLYQDGGDTTNALKYSLQSLKIREEIKDKAGIAQSLTNVGSVYMFQGNIIKALEYLLRSLKLSEETGNKEKVALCLGNLGYIHNQLNDTAVALQYFQKSLDIEKEIQDTVGIMYSLNDIGTIYHKQSNLSRALEYHEESLQLARQTGDMAQLAAMLNNIGRIYSERGDSLSKALGYFQQSLKINEDLGIKREISFSLVNTGEIYLKMKNYGEAENYCSRALALAKELGYPEDISNASLRLSEIFAAEKKYKDAYNMHVLYKQMSDSINNAEMKKSVIRKQMQYDFDKKQSEQKIEQDKKNAVAAAELKSQKTQKYAFIGGSIMLVFLTGLLYNRYQIRTKANEMLEEKNIQIAAEKERAEKEQARAELSEKFKEQFLANMSHEIRTPMNAVIGMTNLVLNSRLDKQQQNYMEAIKKSSQNLLVILNDILDLSKIEAGKMEFEKMNFKLQDVMEQVYSTLRFKAEERSLALNIVVADDVPPVIIGDPVRLSQVLLNLAGNAIKFTETGTVTIGVKKQETQEINHDKAGVKETECRLQFTVKDTGIGIPEDKLDVIFESFNQADRGIFRKYGGSGLGLAIAKELISIQGGSIMVKSKVGAGSAFSFVIPYTTGTAEGLLSEKKPFDDIQRARLSRLKILLAEDNYFNQIVLVDTLKALVPGITIEVAENGREAIDKIKSESFDLILMDVHMPEMNGFEAVRIIRTELAPPLNKIKIIALTASITKNEINSCYAAGMDDYLPKPFEQDELIDKITNLTFARV